MGVVVVSFFFFFFWRTFFVVYFLSGFVKSLLLWIHWLMFTIAQLDFSVLLSSSASPRVRENQAGLDGLVDGIYAKHQLLAHRHQQKQYQPRRHGTWKEVRIMKVAVVRKEML